MIDTEQTFAFFVSSYVHLFIYCFYYSNCDGFVNMFFPYMPTTKRTIMKFRPEMGIYKTFYFSLPINFQPNLHFLFKMGICKFFVRHCPFSVSSTSHFPYTVGICDFFSFHCPQQLISLHISAHPARSAFISQEKQLFHTLMQQRLSK